MDDNKLPLKNPSITSKIIYKIKKHFGDLSVVRGNKHTFLGMNILIKYNIIQIDMV